MFRMFLRKCRTFVSAVINGVFEAMVDEYDHRGRGDTWYFGM